MTENEDTKLRTVGRGNSRAWDHFIGQFTWKTKIGYPHQIGKNNIIFLPLLEFDGIEVSDRAGVGVKSLLGEFDGIEVSDRAGVGVKSLLGDFDGIEVSDRAGVGVRSLLGDFDGIEVSDSTGCVKSLLGGNSE